MIHDCSDIQKGFFLLDYTRWSYAHTRNRTSQILLIQHRHVIDDDAYTEGEVFLLIKHRAFLVEGRALFDGS